MKKRIFYSLLIVAIFCPVFLASNAWAHAIVKKAVPASNSVIDHQPFDIVLEFNARIDLKRSKLLLIDSAGSSQELPLASGENHILRATLKGENPGQYRLRWEVLAQDGHITRGDIPFTVK